VVYINGIGAVSSLGIGMEQVRVALQGQESGIAASEEFGTECGHIAPDFDLTEYTETKYHYLDTATAFTIGVLRMALDDASIDLGSEDPYAFGLSFGSQWSCTGTMEKFQQKLFDSDPKFATPFLFSSSFPNSPVSIASIEFGIKGYNTVYSGTDNSSFMAVMSGIHAVRNTRAGNMAVVGADALSQTVIDFYKDKGLVSDSAACVIIESEKRMSGVEITDFRVSSPDIPDTGYLIQVNGNVIYDNENREIGTGCSMAGAFPLALAIGVDAIRTGKTEEAIVTFKTNNQNGYIVLKK
jgi:3-oxoacyl-(acyl-carrier-protein) synthase